MSNSQLHSLVLRNVYACYDYEQARLANIAKIEEAKGKHKSEGVIRSAAGNLVEAILQNIFATISSQYPEFNIDSKVGSTDCLEKTIHYKGKTVDFGRIQVDRHIWINHKRLAFVENKTYLDSCYSDRALADFRKIAQSLAQAGVDPAEVEYIVFAGQDAASSETLFTYEADFWADTRHLTKKPSGIVPKVFFFLKGKRTSAKPLYRVKHEIDDVVIEEFVNLIVETIQMRSQT